MTLTDPIMRELFEEEAAELLDGIEALLPTSPDAAALSELYRHAHTLKGSAAVMGIAPVSTVAAALEQLLGAVREQPEAAGPGVDEPIRAAVADLRYLVSGVLAGLDVGNVADDAEQSLRSLERAITGADGDAPAADACPGCARLEALVQEVADAQARTLRLLEQLVAASPAPRRGSLLVVDDSRSVREWHRGILSAAGYDVRVAEDGAVALELLSHEAADAVITDLDMPVLDGQRLTEAIRARPELRATPVLVVTSHGDEATSRRLLGAGADAFVAKDRVDSRRLVDEVGKLLGQAV